MSVIYIKHRISQRPSHIDQLSSDRTRMTATDRHISLYSRLLYSALGGETKIGNSIDTAMMTAMTCSPLTYDPDDCRS